MSNGQNWTPAHAFENAELEMQYSAHLKELRRERAEKIRNCQATVKAAKRKCDADIGSMKVDIEKRRLLVLHNIDTLKDQRTILRQHIHDEAEANNDFNQGELMRLTGDIDANRHKLLELDEERQQRTAAIKADYERARETWTNHIQQLNLNYEKKARELREKLMATYRENREKAEQQRQEGGGAV